MNLSDEDMKAAREHSGVVVCTENELVGTAEGSTKYLSFLSGIQHERAKWNEQLRKEINEKGTP